MKRIILISVTGAILIGCVIAQSLAEQSAAGNVSLSLSDKLPDSEKRFVMGEDKGRVLCPKPTSRSSSRASSSRARRR